MNDVREFFDEKRKFDWRTILATGVLLIAQGAIQWGIITTQINELTRRVEKIEQKLDDTMMPRREFEMRHQDLAKEVEDLRERVQRLEINKK